MDDLAFRRVVDDVRERTDLVALIREDVELRPAGSVLKGRSPFRDDKDPSFVVWPHTQTWRDFSGGGCVGGDCFEYVQRRDKCVFMDALRRLAGDAGVELPGARGPEADAELEQLTERRRVESLLTAAAAYYHGVLPAALREEWYRRRYGFSDEIVDRLLLGWADGNLYSHLTGLLGATREEALATGLFVQFGDGRVQDFFRARLVFPYWRRGRVVYFIARATEHTADEPWEQAKYKKLLTRSDRHPYISTTIANDTFYNEDGVRGADEVLITEGVTDCISAMQAGVVCISPVTVRFRHKDMPKLVALTARVGKVVVCNDTETSGAGEAGAVETARALHAAGRSARIATIPLPEGKDKIDVNELVATEGPDALKAVLNAAQRLPAYLIDQVPKDTRLEDLGVALGPVLDLVRATKDPFERDAYARQILDRFQVRSASLRELLRGPKDAGPEERDKPAEKPQDRKGRASRLVEVQFKGEVYEEADHYYVLGRNDEPVVISSFTIEPKARITVEGGEIIDADLTSSTGRVFPNIRMHRDVWLSKRDFMKVLPSPIDLRWTGTDENLQGVLALLSRRDVPLRRGTTCLGYLDTASGPRWVTPDGVLGPLGTDTSGEDVVYVPNGSTLAERVRYRVLEDPRVEAATAAVVLPAILGLNDPSVILPVVGWFFSAPLKPRILKQLSHFPILMVHGTQGGGKSSLIREVFWPLLGVTNTLSYSGTQTEFALLTLLSSTTSIPVFIDEYKPSDTRDQRLNTLHRYMRRLFMGEVEERGRPDRKLDRYHLTAPLCIAGESRPEEPALVERMITSRPDKEVVSRPSCQEAMRRIKAADLGLLSAGIVRFLLGRDTERDLADARDVIDGVLADQLVPVRVRDNLIVLAHGVLLFEEYAKNLGIDLPDLDIEAAVEAVRKDLMDGSGMAGRQALDFFLEDLFALAVNGKLQHGQQYIYVTDTQLAFHLPSCHTVFVDQCSKAPRPGSKEALDRMVIVRQLAENKRAGGYVLETKIPVYFAPYVRRRAVVIDVRKAMERLDVDDFPRPVMQAPPGDSAIDRSQSRYED